MEQYFEHVPTDFWSAHPESRVSLQVATEALAHSVELLRDDTLGLKLGRTLRFGVGGAFDFAVRSAPTVEESIRVASRFTKLLCDSVHFSIETWRTNVVVRIDYDHLWPKATADFAMAAFFRIHLTDQVPESAQLTACLPYPAPRDTTEHQLAFRGARLTFNAPFAGFTFSRGYAAAPLPGADPVLHAAHCHRVEALIESLSRAKSTTTLVQRVIEVELGRGRPTADRVARVLRMSRRTMSRRLEQEGTDFSAELDQVRRDLALKYVQDPAVQLVEVAFLSGFSHVESFHRAFKRWTGMSPLEYRSSRPPATSAGAASVLLAAR